MAMAAFPPVHSSDLLHEKIDRAFVLEMLKQVDKGIPHYLKRQQTDITHSYFGGSPNGYGIYAVEGPMSIITQLAISYSTPQSIYYRDPVLLTALENAAVCLLKFQHEDGTIDLYTTNFHSTPDTGFVVEPIAKAYGLLTRLNDAPTKLMGLLGDFLINAGRAMSVGGIHTPNHRWVVCMSLSRIYSFFPDPAIVRRINEWLAEGIDINEDGEYTERSSGYSQLTDRCLITVSRLMNKPELLDPVRENLELVLYYLHSNNEIVTEISKRSDRYQVTDLKRFFYPYHYMAIKDQNPRFAWASEFVQRNGAASLAGYLSLFLEDDFLLSPLPQSQSPEKNYLRHFEKTDLIRWRMGDTDISALRDNNVFFTLHKGQAVLQAVRFASAFFGKGQFSAQTMELNDDQIVLEQKLEGPYYQPFRKDQVSGDGDWFKMPRSKRIKSEIQHLTSRITITQKDRIFYLQFNIDGTSNVPVALELAFRKGGMLEGVDKVENKDDAYLLSSPNGTYSLGENQIEFGPGRVEHTWTQLRGASSKLDAMSVYITGFTPFEYTLKVG